eukprot:comp10828_c0_seq1/m.5458 comp10828_c0_seq1/g.5458  ORF comp10828_c0_seq1/g.5458 comp10828_c0_seq1/m.5458 type:complete len:225 (-) comp10828_c0_seq1:322-996(-)
MKYLDIPDLDTLASSLCVQSGDKRLVCQLEAYSCKQAGVDKKIYKQFNFQSGHSPHDLQCLSPPTTMYLPANSPVHTEMAERKTLFYLMATLNAAFPDYDFSKANSRQFSREPNLEVVAHAINTTLEEAAPGSYPYVKVGLWSTLDREIGLTDCEVYCYLPSDDADPFAEPGTLWTFNYFFYNPKLKRILFFMCKSLSGMVGDDDSMMDEDGEQDRSLVFGEMD